MQVEKTIHTGLRVLGDIYGVNGDLSGTLHVVDAVTFDTTLDVTGLITGNDGVNLNDDGGGAILNNITLDGTKFEVDIYGSGSNLARLRLTESEFRLEHEDGSGYYLANNHYFGGSPGDVRFFGNIQVDGEVTGDLTIEGHLGVAGTPHANYPLRVNNILTGEGILLDTNSYAAWTDYPSSGGALANTLMLARNLATGADINYNSISIVAYGLSGSDQAQVNLVAQVIDDDATRFNVMLRNDDTSGNQITIASWDHDSKYRWKGKDVNNAIYHYITTAGTDRYIFGYSGFYDWFGIHRGSSFPTVADFAVTASGIQMASLAGGGNRYVYADNNGVLQAGAAYP